jgi:hypothetical protein
VKGDLLADPHSILNRWKNCFQILNAHMFNAVRQSEINATEPLVSDSPHFEVEITTEKLKRYKLSGTDQTPSELIQAGRKEITFWDPQTA